MALAVAEYRQYVALDCLAVYSYRYNALANVVRVLDSDIIGCTAELSGNGEAIPFVGDRRIDLQTVPIRNYTQNVLGNCYEVPCSSTGQPAVLCFAVTLCVLTCDHLSVYIRLGAVQVGVLFFTICRSDLAVVFECLIAVANKCFCTDDPCIVVAEDTSVFLVACRISRDLTVFDVVLGECRLIQNQTVCRVQVLVYALQSLQVCTGYLTEAANKREALRLE